MPKFPCALVFMVGAAWLAGGADAPAVYVQVELSINQLPQEHEYQKTLRAYLATLTEKDFEVERKEITLVSTTDPEEWYRMWLMTLRLHDVSGATLPASPFTLKEIEGKPGLTLPSGECLSLAWLANWNYGGNPYHGSKPIKLRAFVLAAIDLMMLDYLYEHDPRGSDRSDYLGGNLIWLGFTYQAVKDALPANVLAAFEAGLKKHVLRLNRWGPKGLMTDMDLFAPVGLRFISEAMDDAEVKKIARDYSGRLFTDPHFFHPAGYFVDNGCFDTSYNGISLYFGTYAALMGDWKFAREAIDKAFRLRAHLCFPDPDGSFSGPSEMSSRCSSDPPHDQWQFPPKTYGSGMVSDEALYLGVLPSEEQLKGAPASVVTQFNAQLAKEKAPAPQTWREVHWGSALNYAFEFCPEGDYGRRLKLAKENSPLLKPLYLRDETFVRDFAKAFVIVRFKNYAAAVHTGPVGGIHEAWQRPYGFGGGELCAFWTPPTGAVILGRRRGIQGPVYDRFEEWRSWPVHAVTGVTAEGQVVTSARIQQPEVDSRCDETKAEVHVAGIIPKYVAAQKKCVPTDLRYERQFRLDAEGVRVATSVGSTGKEKLSELYETIPIFLREHSGQKMPVILFQVGKNWMDVTAEEQVDPTAGAQSNVNAVRVERFNGAMVITFTRPTRVKLSPGIWTDGFQTQAQCRALLADLLNGKPAGAGKVSIEYTIKVPGPDD